jgi:hypothetical protein
VPTLLAATNGTIVSPAGRGWGVRGVVNRWIIAGEENVQRTGGGSDPRTRFIVAYRRAEIMKVQKWAHLKSHLKKA